MSGKPTALQFLIGYAERSKITPEDLLGRGHVVATCKHCDYEGCEGWQITTPDIVESLKFKSISIVITAESYPEVIDG